MLIMRKQFKKMAVGLLTVGLLITGVTTAVMAASTDIGAVGALADSGSTLKEMLTYAMEDEYLAQAEYDVIMEEYGVQKPFSNIIKAEATHISLLEGILEEYDVEVPERDWISLVAVPESLEAAYETGVEAEEKNIAMYEKFLEENIPDDVKTVFLRLRDASEKHMAAFQRQGDSIANCSSAGTRNDNCSGLCDGVQSGKNSNSMGRRGQGNRGLSQGSCVL